MKICRIIYTYAPYQVGGGDIYTTRISRALAASGHKEVIISISPKHEDIVEDIDGVKVYRFYPANVGTFHTMGQKHLMLQGIWTVLDIYSPYAYYKIAAILKKEKPDIVHIHTPIDLTLSAFDAVANTGFPLVLTVHDYIFLCRRFVLLHSNGAMCTEQNVNPLCRMYRQFCRSILNKKVNMVISPSKFALDVYTANGFFNDCETIVLPHGIELNKEDNPRNEKKDISRAGVFNISYTGGLTKHKGVHLLIAAFKMIKNGNIRLNIVGGGVYEKELRGIAAGDSRIVFCGRYDNHDMRQFYRNSDIMVVPSIWDDVRPNVIPEAFRDGVPVIGAAIGGIPEMVIEDQTGFLFKAGDIADLNRVLDKTINNPQLLKEMSQKAVEFVQQFEMSSYLDKLTSVYARAIEIHNRK